MSGLVMKINRQTEDKILSGTAEKYFSTTEDKNTSNFSNLWLK